MKKQKGITLIALIITIIVMLILVGVTVNVALNGGLFDTAKNATTKTEKASILEQIIAMEKYDKSGNINIVETFSEIKKAFGEDKVSSEPTIDENTTEAIISVIGKTGTYQYKITTVSISEVEEKEPEETSNIRYVYDAGSEQYIVVLKDNYTTLVMNGQDIMKLGTYTENVDIANLSVYDGYDIEGGLENYSTFILNEDGTINYAISDDKSEIYLVKEYQQEQGGTIITTKLFLSDKVGNLTNDVDLSDVTFKN